MQKSMDGNNWYKLALREVYAMQANEFFRLYAFFAIPNEVFLRENYFFLEFLQLVTKMREEYLEYLLIEIGDEIKHYYLSFESFSNKLFSYDDADGLMQRFYDAPRHLGVVDDVLYSGDFNWAKDLFMDIEGWGGSLYYAGPLWAKIVEWTQKLYAAELPEIDKNRYDLNDIERAKYVAFLIDMINSLEHNSGSVLRDMPNEEHVWLHPSLNLVKNIPHPYYLAMLSKDNDLIRWYGSDVIPQEMILTDDHRRGAQQVMDDFWSHLSENDAVQREKLKLFGMSVPAGKQYVLDNRNDINVLKAGADMRRYGFNRHHHMAMIMNSEEILEYLKYNGRIMAALEFIASVFTEDHADKKDSLVSDLLDDEGQGPVQYNSILRYIDTSSEFSRHTFDKIVSSITPHGSLREFFADLTENGTDYDIKQWLYTMSRAHNRALLDEWCFSVPSELFEQTIYLLWEERLYTLARELVNKYKNKLPADSDLKQEVDNT